jgi:hypothetical protein
MPLRVWSYIGGAIALGAFAYAFFLVGLALLGGVTTPGYASLMVVTLMLGGLNLLSLGIMGEYLGRIANEVRNRPLYVVAQAVTGDEGGDDHEKEIPWIDPRMRA